MSKSKIRNVRTPISFSGKKFKKAVTGLIGVIILLLILASIPATSNLPIVSYVKSLLGHALTSDEQNMKTKHDNARGKNFNLSDGLSNTARSHSKDMAKRGDIYHNSSNEMHSYANSVCSNWTLVGQNVGVSPDVESMFQAFMNSPEHRDNIMDKRYTHIGIGIVTDGSGQLYGTINFVQCPGSTTPPSNQSGGNSQSGQTGQSNNNNSSQTPTAPKDNSHPLTPTRLRLVAVYNTSLTVEWDPGSDNVAVAKYRLFLAGKVRGDTANAGILKSDILGLAPCTQYRVTVLSVDTSNNVSIPTDKANAGRTFERYFKTVGKCPA